jgi:hypothetical protein
MRSEFSSTSIELIGTSSRIQGGSDVFGHRSIQAQPSRGSTVLGNIPSTMFSPDQTSLQTQFVAWIPNDESITTDTPPNRTMQNS